MAYPLQKDCGYPLRLSHKHSIICSILHEALALKLGSFHKREIEGKQMDILLSGLLFLVGILLIVKGGDYFVDGACWMARATGIPDFIIGATIVSIATTLPELFVSVMAAVDGKADMALGNAMGSVTANLGLILGIGILWRPSTIQRAERWISMGLMLLATAYLIFVSQDGSLSFVHGVGLFVILAVVMWDNLRLARKSSLEPDQREKVNRQEILKQIGLFVVGIAGVLIGAQLLVNEGSSLAELLGIPERVIGVTMVALGTSLPELVTTITALRKGQTALSVGNIIGANLTNLTLVLPLAALVSGGALTVSAASLSIDMPVALAIGGLAVVPSLIGGRFYRWQGALLLVAYVAYVLVTCLA